MVAISLYRGKLHRTPDVPRQWLMPTPKISLKDFKTLLNRRSRALSRIQGTPNPSPNPNLNSDEGTNSGGGVPPQSDGAPVEDVAKDEGTSKVNGDRMIDELAKSICGEEGFKGQKGSKVGDEDESLVVHKDESAAVDDAKAVVQVPEKESNAVDVLQQEGKTDAPLQHQPEPVKSDTLTDIEKRKKEVEEKLQILNARKHNLVQVLKQILNAEEELRRRSNGPGSTGRPSISLQVDVGNDSGSMSRHITPRPGSENCNGEMEGADADDGSNQNLHSRNLPRMSSVSPSSDSLHRRATFTTVPNSARATSGVAASSPSRFAPTGHQATPTSLPTVSVTGTNYIASSPSPAGSGGTSVFRDARLPSPWN